MILTGRRVEAEEAHSMGLINRLVEPGNTISEAVKLANEIIQNPLIPMLSDRDAVYKNISVAGISEQIDNEIENGRNAVNRNDAVFEKGPNFCIEFFSEDERHIILKRSNL
mgnify:CR=1 FL=1